MDRIVIEHLTGEKANQREVFATNRPQSLLVGRDLSAQVRFTDASDSVSRQHARIEYDPSSPDQLQLKQLGSRNGLLLNGRLITGDTALAHGDRVQVGHGGPEFVVHQEPPPPIQAKPTRIVELPGATREVVVAPAGASVQGEGSADASGSSRPVGRGTVELMLQQQQGHLRKSTTKIAGIAAGVVVVLVAGIFGFAQWQQSKSLAETQAAAEQAAAAASASALAAVTKVAAQIPPPASPSKEGWEQRTAAEYAGSVIYIEASWKLVHAGSKKPVYHRYEVVGSKGKTQAIPMYAMVAKGVLEPVLTTDPNAGVLIGGTHTGTGFIVNTSGFALTNRHVAARWMSSMPDILQCPCVVVVGDQKHYLGQPTRELQAMIRDWVPAQSKQGGGGFFGENQILDVTFQNSRNRNSARLSQVSSQHDVALVRVDVPFEVKPVPLATADETPAAGQTVLTMGYPGVSPRLVARTESQDPFNRQTQLAVVPGVSVTSGMVSRILKPSADGTQVSLMGDSYQLTINATGPGNSGGPVFDNSGKVSGVFFAGNDRLTFAVPIKYGLELLQQGGSVPKGN